MENWSSEGWFCYGLLREAMRFFMVFSERDLFFEEASVYLRAIDNNVLSGIDFWLRFW